MKKIAFIRTGGQTGVDRAALDFAEKNGLPILGWCPKKGWAEDMPTAPGIRARFPELQETPSDDVAQRTRWNVRDSHATLIIRPDSAASSDGTSVTAEAAKEMRRPLLEVRDETSAPEVAAWLMTLGNELILNVAGPRESECPEAYRMTGKILEDTVRLLKEIEGKEGALITGYVPTPKEGENEAYDPAFLRALKVVIKEGKASISLIQRRCTIGYSHAGKIIETMERMGYVTPFENTAKSRAVLITKEDFIAKYGDWDRKQ